MPDRDGNFILQSQNLIREQIMPVLEREPSLRITPDEYTHMVKLHGGHRVSKENLLQTIRGHLLQEDEISLYLHMPICHYRCGFCHYPVIVSDDTNKRGLYVDALRKESELFLSAIPEVKNKKVTSLYFGGGTPTLMSPTEIHQLLAHFRRQYRMDEGVEISFEGTPETYTVEKVQCLRDAGINRVSVGVQILDNQILEQCNRHHTTEQAIDAVHRLVTAGFEQVNVDLIYGFPGQTMEKLQQDIEAIIRLKPEGITLYRLRLRREDELKTAMIKHYFEHPEGFPTPEEVYAMQVLGRMLLESSGYQEGPSGWFSRSHRKVKVYRDRWEDQKPLIAFGWHTYSYADDFEYYNCSNPHEYLKCMFNNELPLAAGAVYSQVERQRRFIAFRLKSLLSVSESDFQGRFGRSFLYDEYWSRLTNRLVELNLLCIDNGEAKLNSLGRILVEEILEKCLK